MLGWRPFFRRQRLAPLKRHSLLIISLLIMSVAYDRIFSRRREVAFALHDAARLLRTYSDHRARELNTTRAQWSVLVRLQRCEGAKQSELADALDIAPITPRPPDRQARRGGAGRAARRPDRPARPPALPHRKGDPDARRARRPRRGRDGPRARRPRRRDRQDPSRGTCDHQGQPEIGTSSGSVRQVTQSSSAVREEAPEAPIPAPKGETLQFTPARTPAPHPAPAPQAAPPAPAPTPMVVKTRKSGSRRFILLVVIPLLALAAGFAWWLTGGRYITTDNAYVGADKSLITPQVTGAIVGGPRRRGSEGQGRRSAVRHRSPALPDRARARARAGVDAAKVAFDNLKASYLSNKDQIKMGQDAVNVRKSDFDRKNELATRGSGTSVDRDTSLAALIQAQQILDIRQQPAVDDDHQARREPRRPDRKIPGVHAGEGGPRRRRAQSAQHQGARADRRRRDAGQPDRARSRRRGGPAGVRRRRPTRACGSTAIRRNRT